MIGLSQSKINTYIEAVHPNVAKAISDNMGISHPVVSQKIDRARHYYNHVSWCRDEVDIIVKEVRDVRGS